MNLTKNKNTYVYFLYRDALTYLQKVAVEDKYTTPVIEFYDKIVEVVSQAKDTGRKRLFLDGLSNRIRNTKTCARSLANSLLRTIAYCLNVNPATLLPKVNPEKVNVNLLTDPEKEVITAEEETRKADYYGYVNIFEGI